MQVLVTGASGYLGGKLCHAVVGKGHTVRAFVRRTSNLGGLIPFPATINGGSLDLAYGDISDYNSLLLACSDCQIIFHVAALVEAWLPDPSKFISVNVGGLKNVLRAVAETKTVVKVIYTSSIFALGCTDGGYIANETQVHEEKFFCTEYEKSKVFADKIATKAALDGFPIVAVYPGLIYGPGKVTSGNVVARTLIERFNGRLPGYIGSGNDIISLCHVEDVVNGHVAAMDIGRIGERYLLTGENVSFNHLFDVAAIITGTRKPWFHSYSFMAVTILRHQWAYSCDKSKLELGYNPRSLGEGLTEVLSWLKSLGLVKY
ncbi:farnesol dehydrogenase (NAD(+)) [Ranunculus cassubicifolius]